MSFRLLKISENVFKEFNNNLEIIRYLNSNQDKQILILLNSPILKKKPSNYINSIAGFALLDEINNAKESIDFAIYGIRNQDTIIKALQKAKERGVKIRGIVDKDVNNENYYTSTDKLIHKIGNIVTDYASDLKVQDLKKNDDFNIPYCKGLDGYNGPIQCIGYSLNPNECIIASHASKEELLFQGDIMHNKFFVFDKKNVWTGSTNISDSGTGGYNANASLLIKNADIALIFQKEFEEMFVFGKFHRAKKFLQKESFMTKIVDSIVEVAFSPQSYVVERLIRPLIKGAKEYIDLPIFFLTHKKLAGDLINAHQRGVKVRVILDATAATNGYSKHEILRAVGIPVKVENWGGKMHMKVAVIDGEHLIMGSMNWTSAGERSNDENTVIIKNKHYADEVHTFFNELWDSIDDKRLKGQPNPEGLSSYYSCFDGVDNNFNDIVDEKENNCKRENTFVFKTLPYSIVEKKTGNNLIKGNINDKKQKIYILPNSKYYPYTKIDINNGEKWFCSVYDAMENGWISYRKYY